MTLNATTRKTVKRAAVAMSSRPEILGSNLGRDTSYGEIFRGFSQSGQVNSGEVYSVSHGHFLHITSHHIIRRYII
jgi:hypothetical protein